MNEKYCYYCLDIYNSTPASPRRNYKYCPMCGVKLDFTLITPADKEKRDKEETNESNI